MYLTCPCKTIAKWNLARKTMDFVVVRAKESGPDNSRSKIEERKKKKTNSKLLGLTTFARLRLSNKNKKIQGGADIQKAREWVIPGLFSFATNWCLGRKITGAKPVAHATTWVWTAKSACPEMTYATLMRKG